MINSLLQSDTMATLFFHSLSNKSSIMEDDLMTYFLELKNTLKYEKIPFPETHPDYSNIVEVQQLGYVRAGKDHQLLYYQDNEVLDMDVFYKLSEMSQDTLYGLFTQFKSVEDVEYDVITILAILIRLDCCYSNPIMLENGSHFWPILTRIYNDISVSCEDCPSLSQLIASQQILLHFLSTTFFETKDDWILISTCLEWFKNNYESSEEEIKAINNCLNYQAIVNRDDTFQNLHDVKNMPFEWMFIMSCILYGMDEEETGKKNMIGERIKNLWTFDNKQYVMSLFAFESIYNQFPNDVLSALCKQMYYVVNFNTDVAEILYRMGKVPPYQLICIRDRFCHYVQKYLKYGNVNSIKSALFCLEYTVIDSSMLEMLKFSTICSEGINILNTATKTVLKFILENIVLNDQQILYIISQCINRPDMISLFIKTYNIKQKTVDLCIRQINDLRRTPKSRRNIVICPDRYNFITQSFINDDIAISSFYNHRKYVAVSAMIKDQFDMKKKEGRREGNESTK